MDARGVAKTLARGGARECDDCFRGKASAHCSFAIVPESELHEKEIPETPFDRMNRSAPPAIPEYPSLAARQKIPLSKWLTARQIFARQLDLVLTVEDPASLVRPSLAFLKSYLHEYAHSVLDSSGMELMSTDVNDVDDLIRQKCLLLLHRLASVSGVVDLKLLLDSAVVYMPRNHKRMVQIATASLSASPSLLNAIASQAVPAFIQVLQRARETGIESNDALRKASYCIVRLLQCGPQIVDAFFGKDFLIAIASAYQSLAASPDLLRIHNGPAVLETGWAQTKVNLMDAFHILLQKVLLSQPGNPGTDSQDGLYDLLLALFDLASSTNTAGSSSKPTTSESLPFTNGSMLADYESSYGLSETLLTFGLSEDSRREYLVVGLKGLATFSAETNVNLSNDRQSDGSATNGASIGSDPKGKSRAVEEEFPSETRDLDLETSQVLDIFPDEDPAFIRTCLRHPAFSNSVEQLIAALIECNLPPNLASQRSQAPEQKEVFPLLESRRNAFDDDPLDFSRLRIGKNRRGDADIVLQDRSFLDAAKADILRRVQEMADEEEEDLRGMNERVVAFEEELEEDGAEDPSVPVVNDGGETSGSESEDGEEDVKPDVESLLEQTYLRDPKLFNRDAATRRSKQRVALKSQTGWTDEQLEGWKIMLERNPRKEAILQKHEFAGNKPVYEDSGGVDGMEHASDRGEGSGRGRGDGAHRRGRGRGGAPDGPARDRAWKDKNKARHANHDRKRGHDKKMARGGAIPPS